MRLDQLVDAVSCPEAAGRQKGSGKAEINQ